jgi:hypothetical protein
MAGELMEEDQRCPEDLLERPDKGKLNHWLSRFVAEVRNKKGEPYAPRTIVLAGLQRYNYNPAAPKFLDKDEPCFRELRRTCDNVYRDLRAKGIGTEAPVITPEEEEALWMSSVLNVAFFVYKLAMLCI